MIANKVIFISDALNVSAGGARTVSYSHWNALKNIYGGENVICVNLSGIDKKHYGDFLSLNVSNNPILRLYNLMVGNTGKIDKHIIEYIIKLIGDQNIEMVFVDNSTYGKLSKTIKENYEEIILCSYYADVKGSLCKEWIRKKPLKYPVYRNIMKNERMVQRYSDINFVLNLREKNSFKKCYRSDDSTILKIPVPKPKETAACNDMVLGDMPILFFIGAYYYPNVNGITWFVNDVFPSLSDGCRLIIAGNGMEVLNKRFSKYRNIEIHGRIDNLEYYYNIADVVIGPIFEGAGMKVKTAEAFSYGKCFVGTQESLMGYIEDVPPKVLGEKIFCANTEKEFAYAINYIINCGYEKFNNDIYNIYRENYSETAIANGIRKALGKIKRGN